MDAMKMKHLEVSTAGPALPVVVKEITEKLLTDDWYRMSTQDGARRYYVVGAAEESDLDGDADFCCFQFPIPTNPGPLSQWAVRSQLADNKPADILIGARKNLEAAGVRPAAIDRFLAGDNDLSDWGFHRDVPADERITVLLNFLQAARLSLSDARSLKLSRDEEAEAKVAREKICLDQLATRYSKIVDRWEQFERLPFDDPQLEEASKTFLYGFYRAAVVLCASAVETQLKRLIPSAPTQATAFQLIALAEKAKLFEGDLGSYGRDLFSYRNRVTHDNAEPEYDKAKEVLAVARMLVAKLRSRTEQKG
jgi:hypothetical protein